MFVNCGILKVQKTISRTVTAYFTRGKEVTHFKNIIIAMSLYTTRENTEGNTTQSIFHFLIGTD